jgi:hypothetical protein
VSSRHASPPRGGQLPATGHAWSARGAALAALGALLERGLPREGLGGSDNGPSGRAAAMRLTAASAAVAVAMSVTMAVYTGTTARWVAFALGCALVGVSPAGLG